ncbi:hypothetical protein ACOTTU_16995 [Roseobacter sp. EG26]|uniref:hypothetical protein n=1 Tax=Roseobacter sp. EG26 TaxID=3412477 RepID=UPI003CE5B27E
MLEPPDLHKLQNDFLHDISARSDAVLLAGLDHETVTFILRQLSTEAAMKGGPVPLYKHSYLMEDDAKTLRTEFEARFPDLDKDALIKGKITRK